MLSIKLFDNDLKGSPLFVKIDNDNTVSFSELTEIQKSIIRKALDLINNVSLKDLESKGIIIFPSRSVESDLNDNGKIVCSVQNIETDFPIIKTTNVMGFFGIGNNVQISIHSRFDTADKQFFLHHMLQKVCNVSPTVELTRANKNPLYEFIVYLFPSFLKKAINQGLFRTYINKEYNDSNIRGTIDFSKHFRLNIPFNGKIAYKTREYSYDNFITQLIRHTVEFIAESNEIRKILSIDNDMKNSVQTIRDCTDSYNKASRQFIINKNLKVLSHPYYTEYEKLRRLCIMILCHDKISYGLVNQNEVNGILFDGASLWEEYLVSIFQDFNKQKNTNIIIEHPNNRTGKGRSYLFETIDGYHSTAIYPDIIFKDLQNNYLSILDAKYKKLEDASISRDDYFQLLSYLFRFSCKQGSLLYPYSQKDKKPDTHFFLAEHNREVCLSVYGLELCEYSENCEYSDYLTLMEKCEQQFCEKVITNEL